MKPLNLVPIKPNLNFIGRKKIFFTFSVLLVALAIGLFTSRGLNFGIDFQGGILIEVRMSEGGKLAEMRTNLSNLGLGEVALQEFGQPTDILIRIQKQEGGEKAQQVAVDKLKAALGDGVKYRRTEFVGPQVSRELFRDGVIAVMLAIVGILAYIWFRFEWQFGLGAIIALLHDVITTIGIFALTGLEFNLSTVAAILTIAGYSINDTVVVYDRVRENLRKYKTMPLLELLNNSINETLSRTVMTSLTTMLALVSLYVLGGEVIRGFSFALIWGVVIGTYSSICVAVPLLLYLNVNRGVQGSGRSSHGEQAEPAE
ncbi:MAG: protein translocase subunit SecF [Rhodospirillaceae bacterium]|jgi:preprotein translocase subunit SecF|nr:protein translocase subunit SecF [Rhodospirillaceae bacterium]MBT3884827.1 protein translocase subunit SecF [Rhodospirillaceae bacterium]MBT4115251.1 protein translocase subunit SecF [Rhodospirillaceae bacterium]MBT4671148.1 protein translocase subunit SecF [Rhodospirillaceae bacterium]MBT4721404.1 protein translocase subunit SecF [Rhodospirillaceae bacterium]